jgi:glycosyltransferase involved in cell wall biosynthesis
MRILWIGPWRADALSTQVRGSMAQAIHDAGNEIGTIVIGERGSWKTGGYDWVHYCPIPKTALGRWVNQARMSRVIGQFRGDLLVLGEKAAHLAPIAALVRKCLRRQWKIVIDIRTLPIPDGGARGVEARGKRFWKQLRIGFPFADAWMAITDRLREAVQERIKTRDLPSEIWGSAVDRRFLDCGESVPAENIVGCGHDCNLLYLGSFGKGRRIDLAIRAMADLDNPQNRVGLHIVGSGDHLQELKSMVGELQVADVVHIWDAVSYAQVPSTILACQLGILPLPDCDAWNTSSALKVYEYLGVGTPVLVSDIPAHRDAVGGKPFAFFMDQYSTRGFNDALARFLECSEAEYADLRRQAAGFVRDGHTWDHRAGVIHDFLASISLA